MSLYDAVGDPGGWRNQKNAEPKVVLPWQLLKDMTLEQIRLGEKPLKAVESAKQAFYRLNELAIKGWPEDFGPALEDRADEEVQPNPPISPVGRLALATLTMLHVDRMHLAPEARAEVEQKVDAILMGLVRGVAA